MYKMHKYIFLFMILALILVSTYFKIDYAVIASEGITVVSIVLAIYMTAFSNLVSSDLALEMQKKEDKRVRGKSQLGVLRTYLNAAVTAGIINIILSCCILLLNNKVAGKVEMIKGYYLLSATGMASLGLNLMLMFLLYKFMVNRQLWNK